MQLRTHMLQIHCAERVLTITFSRPEKKNALTDEMYGALAQALERAETDAAIHVILFQADGNVFCAGNDLSDFQAIATGRLPAEQMKGLRFLSALASATKPYVAAVQGPAVGIGATLLLHCDLVHLAEEASLAMPFAQLALVPEAASSMLLPQRIGHARAFAMFALGETLSAQQALQLGLANAVHPQSQLKEAATRAAHLLAERPLGALQATKRLMRDAAAISAVMSREAQVFAERLQSPEARAAFADFLKKGAANR